MHQFSFLGLILGVVSLSQEQILRTMKAQPDEQNPWPRYTNQFILRNKNSISTILGLTSLQLDWKPVFGDKFS